MTENISSNKTQLQLRFVLKNKALKSKVRRINLKWILLNQWKWILDKLFRILRRGYQPVQLYLRVGLYCPPKPLFSWFAQVMAQVQAIARVMSRPAVQWACDYLARISKVSIRLSIHPLFTFFDQTTQAYDFIPNTVTTHH